MFHPAFHKHRCLVDLGWSLHDSLAKTFQDLDVIDGSLQHSVLCMVCEKHTAGILRHSPYMCLQLRIAHAGKRNSNTHKNYGPWLPLCGFEYFVTSMKEVGWKIKGKEARCFQV